MKTILQIAEEEGAIKKHWRVIVGDEDYDTFTFTTEELERFVARIRAEQKALDAQICDAMPDHCIPYECAEAIRNASPESDID